MNRTPQEIIDWLLQHCERDRVVRNALCNHKHKPEVVFWGDGWLVTAISRTLHSYPMWVDAGPVGEPVSWHRL